MGVCKICGKNYGMFGGIGDTFTGSMLTVCEDCFNDLRQIDKWDNDAKVSKIASEMVAKCNDEKVVKILESYIQRSEKENERKTIEEKNKEELQERMVQVENDFYKRRNDFKMTTGYTFDGFEIKEYRGIVSGEVVLGTGFLSEFAASVSDMLGTTSNVFANKMLQAKQGALDNLIKNALYVGGNALIGVDFDYITFSNNILGVSANGTAVTIEKIE